MGSAALTLWKWKAEGWPKLLRTFSSERTWVFLTSLPEKTFSKNKKVFPGPHLFSLPDSYTLHSYFQFQTFRQIRRHNQLRAQTCRPCICRFMQIATKIKQSHWASGKLQMEPLAQQRSNIFGLEINSPSRFCRAAAASKPSSFQMLRLFNARVVFSHN